MGIVCFSFNDSAKCFPIIWFEEMLLHENCVLSLWNTASHRHLRWEKLSKRNLDEVSNFIQFCRNKKILFTWGKKKENFPRVMPDIIQTWYLSVCACRWWEQRMALTCLKTPEGQKGWSLLLVSKQKQWSSTACFSAIGQLQLGYLNYRFSSSFWG